MSCPHFSISIRQRSKRQSAVAGAAYQSGEKLFSEYDGKTKNYRHKSGEVLAKGILLPKQARPEYADRQTLWNAVEKTEGQWNAQLARGIILALPNEIPKEAYEPLVRDYCLEQFVSRGMAADFAIHDKGDGNPHAHILLTTRAMDENGNWLPKARKVYDLDENGERIRLPSGSFKSHKENTVDWDRRENAELWRSAWAGAVNRYYEKYGVEEKLDLRSFARQGKEEVPTIHLGPAVSHLEEKGVRTELGEYNRQIKEHNAALTKLKKLIAHLSDWLSSATKKLTELAKTETPPPTILDFVTAYADMHRAGKNDWGARSKQTASVNDVKFSAQVFFWMQVTGIRTVEDFQKAVSVYQTEFDRLSENQKAIRKLDTTLRHMDTILRLKPIHDQSKKGFEKAKARYAEAHREKLEQFSRSVRYLKANKLNVSDREQYAAQRDALIRENEAMERSLRAANFDPELINRIRYLVNRVLESNMIPQHQATVSEKIKQTSNNETTPIRIRTERAMKEEKEDVCTIS